MTVYIDDILVYTKGTHKQYWIAVNEVLDRIAAEGLCLDIKKSAFGTKEVMYLGYIL